MTIETACPPFRLMYSPSWRDTSIGARQRFCQTCRIRTLIVLILFKKHSTSQQGAMTFFSNRHRVRDTFGMHELPLGLSLCLFVSEAS